MRRAMVCRIRGSRCTVAVSCGDGPAWRGARVFSEAADVWGGDFGIDLVGGHLQQGGVHVERVT
jgi:hypothetical protein